MPAVNGVFGHGRPNVGSAGFQRQADRDPRERDEHPTGGSHRRVADVKDAEELLDSEGLHHGFPRRLAARPSRPAADCRPPTADTRRPACPSPNAGMFS